MMGPHRKITAALHLVFGVGALLPVLIVGVVFGGITGITALASNGHPHGVEDTVIVGLTLSAIVTLVFIAVGLIGLAHLFAGVGLFRRSRWADGLALIVSALHIFNFPFGTAFAVYTWWTLLKEEPMQGAFDFELKSGLMTA
jgi:hypothetical protein